MDLAARPDVRGLIENMSAVRVCDETQDVADTPRNSSAYRPLS